MKLKPLPKSDGARMGCSVDLPLKVWPYTQRCAEDAVGLVPDTYPAPFLVNSMVCAKHWQVLLNDIPDDDE